MMNQNMVSAFNKMMKQADANDVIPQDPYDFHTVWVSAPLKDLPADGAPSPVWTAGDHKWRVIIFKNGMKDIKGYLSIFLFAVRIEDERKVTYTIKSNGKVSAEKSATFTFSKAINNNGFKDFIPLSEINDYLDDGKLNLDISIKFSPPQVKGRIDYRKLTGYVGLKNQGMTCYLNSMVEVLFHTPAFRRIIYSISTESVENPEKSIPLNLQKLFALMQLAPIAPSTYDLTKSFGWGDIEAFTQHDVQEFIRILLDNLEEKMKETPNKNAIPNLLRGKFTNYIKATTFDYESENKEDFYDIDAVVRGNISLERSLEEMVHEEQIKDYNVEGHGKDVVMKGTQFLELPPVIHVLLQRFEYNAMMFGGQTKILDHFTFPETLDMAPYLSPKSPHMSSENSDTVYELTGVIVHDGASPMAGHYYCFVRPGPEKKWFEFNDDSVRETSSAEAIEGNFGGRMKRGSAYYLAYTRKSQIEELMKPVTDDEVPEHLREFVKNWIRERKGLPPLLSMQVLTPSDFTSSKIEQLLRHEQIQSSAVTAISGDQLMKNAQLPLKKAIGEDGDASMFTLDSIGVPRFFVPLNCRIGDVFKDSQKVLVAPNREILGHLEGRTIEGRTQPLIVAEFNPISARVSFLFFVSLKPEESVADVIKEAGFDVDDVDAFIVQEGVVSRIAADEEIGSRRGILALQRRKRPKFVVIDEEAAETKYCYDLLPELRAKDFEQYAAYVSSAVVIDFDEINGQTGGFKLEISSGQPFATLVRCVRASLGVGDSDGVLLFRHGTHGVSEQPITAKTGTVGQLVRGRTCAFAVVKGTSQEDLESRIYFRIDIMKEGRLSKTAALLMPEKFSVADVIKKLKDADLVPFKNARVLQLSGARIVKAMQPAERLEGALEMHYRVEEATEPADGCFFVRATQTENRRDPRSGTVGVPFLFEVRPGEKGAETKKRLAVEAGVEEEKASFGVSVGPTTKYEYIKDGDVLMEKVGKENASRSMVYIFVPAAKGPGKPVMSHSGSGIHIYN